MWLVRHTYFVAWHVRRCGQEARDASRHPSGSFGLHLVVSYLLSLSYSPIAMCIQAISNTNSLVLNHCIVSCCIPSSLSWIQTCDCPLYSLSYLVGSSQALRLPAPESNLLKTRVIIVWQFAGSMDHRSHRAATQMSWPTNYRCPANDTRDTFGSYGKHSTDCGTNLM